MSGQEKFMPRGQRLLDFVVEAEPWSQYKLEDGTIVRVRLNMTRAIDSGKRDEKGVPMINFNFVQVVDVVWPEHIQAEIDAKTGGHQP